MSDAGQAQTKGLDKAILRLNHALTHAGPVFWVAFYGFALILAIALAATLMISGLRDREMSRAGSELESTVRLLAKQFDGRIADFEAVPQSVASYLSTYTRSDQEFAELASTEAFHVYLKNKLSDTTDFAGVNVFDSNGIFLSSSERWPVPRISLADRSFYQTFKSKPDSPQTLFQLVDSKLSEGKTIVLARKVSAPDGTFLGMVTRSIAPARFETFFSTATPDNALGLFQRDGALLAQYPHFEDNLASSLFESPLMAQAFTEGASTLLLDGLADGQERLVSAKSLEHYPFVVVASKLSSSILAGWTRETRTLAVAALLAALVVALMLVAIVKYLREQHRRLDIAVNNMAQGLLLYDSQERLVLCNDRFLNMFGLSTDVVRPGTKLQQIVQHRKDTGTFIGDVDEHCKKVRESSLSGSSVLHEISDGRWIQIQNKAVQGGGWVCTIEDVTEQRRNEEQAIRLASYDALTGLPNRALLREHLERELVHCSDENQVAVLFLDMDEFKLVNDTLGHIVGDDLLKSVADTLRSCAGPGALVARLGGDEFAVVVSDVRSESEIVKIVQDIFDAIRRPHNCGSHKLSADTSIGIALAPYHGSTCDELLQNADLAMYDAKWSGKRTYRLFDSRLEKKARDRRQLELDLRDALKAGAIDVFYQPIVDLRTNDVIGCEALARWTHPERGVISPAEFVPVAEQSGLIDELGEYVVKAACKEAASWPKGKKVAVNVSPLQLKSNTFPLKVFSALAQSGLQPHCLELEITEAVLIGDDEAALNMLRELKATGIRVALDDFGTGYSSLSYLHRFPFDKIKIDRSFIKDLTGIENNSSAIVRAIVTIATEHNMVTTAEGVETGHLRELLQELNCAQMQGFLFSRARSGPEVFKLMNHGVAEPLASTA